MHVLVCNYVSLCSETFIGHGNLLFFGQLQSCHMDDIRWYRFWQSIKIITLFDLLLRYTVKWKIVPIIKLFTIQYLRRDLCMVCL